MMKKRIFVLGAGTALLVTAGYACDSQVPGTYQGEVLASLHGAVANQSGSDQTQADIGLLRPYDVGKDSSFSDIQRVSVVGSFPANFRLDLYEPPKSLSPGPGGEEHYMYSFQTIAPIASETPDYPKTPTDCLLGDRVDAVVLYLDRDVGPDEPAPITGWACDHAAAPKAATPDAGPSGCHPLVTASQFFGSRTRGYHLVKPHFNEAGDIDHVEDLPDGFATSLKVVIDREPGPGCSPRVMNDAGVH
jgi:hypothetical protein